MIVFFFSKGLLLPLPVFLFAIVDEGTIPAVGAADGGDDFLIFGEDEVPTVAHLEVLGAANVPDEFLGCYVPYGLACRNRSASYPVSHPVVLPWSL